jgi:hypothetical protein
LTIPWGARCRLDDSVQQFGLPPREMFGALAENQGVPEAVDLRRFNGAGVASLRQMPALNRGIKTPEDRLAIPEGEAHTLPDRIRFFAR